MPPSLLPGNGKSAAGCDAVELNFSCRQMKYEGMGSDVGQSAELVKHYTACVKGCMSGATSINHQVNDLIMSPHWGF